MLPTLPPHVPPSSEPSRVGEFLNFRASRWLIGVIIGVGLLWAAPVRESPPGPVPIGPQAPVQQWSTAPDFSVIGRVGFGKLPPPDPRQRRKPCDPDFEVEMEGLCWVPIAVEPCPEDKLIRHNGKCWSRALNVQRVPQSGEPRAGNVAGEP